MNTNRFVIVFYDQIAEDPKFDTIRDGLTKMGLWLRLLTLADPLWPQSAPVPLGTPMKILQELADSGIVELLPGHRYKVHGLDSERARRTEKATRAANAMWTKRRSVEDASALLEDDPSNAQAMHEHSFSSAKAMPRALLPSSISVNDVGVGEEVESPADAPIAYMEVMGFGCSQGSRAWEWCVRLGKQYTVAAFRQALADEAAVDRVSPILKRVELRLQLGAARAVKPEPPAEDWWTKERARRAAMVEAER